MQQLLKRGALVTLACLLAVLTSGLPSVSAYATTPADEPAVETKTLQNDTEPPTPPEAPQHTPAVKSQNMSTSSFWEPKCVDASDPDNIGWTWVGNDTIYVWAKEGIIPRKVCDDVTLYFTSYIMPDTWDKNGFNSTAVPQTLFSSTSVTFEKDSSAGLFSSGKTLKVQLPNKCKNAQIDLYYAPEITSVDISGHGAQYLDHKFRKATKTCQPATPTATVGVTPCTTFKTTDEVTVSVTNPADKTMNTVTYTVTIGTTSAQITLADGATGTVTFVGLTKDTYTATIVGSDGTTVITDEFTVNYCEPPVIDTCSQVPQTFNLTANDFLAAYSDTRSTGHYDFTPDGLHLWTEGATSTDKVAEYWAINKPLQQIGIPSLSYTNNSGGEPGLQLVVDFDNDGTPDGILVGETVYGNDWWLNTAAQQFVKDNAPHTGGGNGSPWYGTLNEWLAQFPDAQVLAGGFSLGSGVKGDGVITAITIGCAVYTFTEEVKPVDVCVNIPGLQITVPTGYVLANGECGKVAGDTDTKDDDKEDGHTLGTQLPAQLPATGVEQSSASFMLTMFAMIATYGAVYFLQGKRSLEQNS